MTGGHQRSSATRPEPSGCGSGRRMTRGELASAAVAARCLTYTCPDGTLATRMLRLVSPTTCEVLGDDTPPHNQSKSRSVGLLTAQGRRASAG
ncbi:hypothetical protein ACFPRL_26035 [Pseudoclavibacter helvolus]